MANLSDHTSHAPQGMSNGLKGFLLGVVVTLVLEIIGGGIYFFARQSAAPVANAPTNTATTNTATAAPDATTAPGNNSTSTTNTASPSSSIPASSTGLPAAETLNLQASHSNGTSINVTGISFAEDNILLSMSVTNGHGTPITLNRTGRMGDTMLQDDLGNQYNLVLPPNNTTLSVNANTTLKGQFSFAGRIAPGARSLTLNINSVLGDDTTNDISTAPKFVVEIPLQGAN